MNPLVVGLQAAPSATPDWVPLDERSDSGRRLVALAGLVPGALHLRADVVNLLHPSDRPTVRLCRRRGLSLSLVLTLLAHDRVVLLGHLVADALRDVTELPRGASYFAGYPTPWGGQVYLSPHPSGLSRAWNDPATRVAGRDFWAELFRQEPTE